MGRIPLEIALQRAMGAGQCQLVIRQGEMVHADVDITGLGQTANGQFEQLQLALRRWHVLRANQPLRAHHLRQMRITVGSNPVRAQGNDLGKGDVETLHRLQGQAVNQIDADRLELRLARRRDQRINLRFTLLAIDRRLDVGIEVLHAKAQAIEAQLAQRMDLFAADGARVDLDGKLMVVAVVHVECLVQAIHQVGQLFLGQIRRCAPAQMQLRKLARAVEQSGLHGDFTLEVGQVFDGPMGFLGNDFVAGAVVTKAFAERNVDVHRQRFRHRGLVAVVGGTLIVVNGKRLMKLRRRWVRGVARPGPVIFFDQGTIEIE
ncbi:hypothetical protein D3C84_312620 [compost metagenome]